MNLTKGLTYQNSKKAEEVMSFIPSSVLNLKLTNYYAAAPAIFRHSLAHWRQASAHSLQWSIPWWACFSHSSAQVEQISAQMRQRSSAYSPFKLITWAAA